MSSTRDCCFNRLGLCWTFLAIRVNTTCSKCIIVCEVAAVSASSMTLIAEVLPGHLRGRPARKRHHLQQGSNEAVGFCSLIRIWPLSICRSKLSLSHLLSSIIRVRILHISEIQGLIAHKNLVTTILANQLESFGSVVG